MYILRVVDRSVTLWEEPWRERFEKNIENVEIFVIFDDFSPILVGAGRGAV